MAENPLKIAPGLYTSVSLSRSFKSSLPQPYSNCLIDNQKNLEFQSELFNLIQNSLYRYTQPTCFLQCLQGAILLECECTDPSLLSLFPHTAKCFTQNETKCMSDLFDEQLFKIDFFDEHCFKECPLECYQDQFEASLSSTEFLPDAFVDYLHSKSSLLEDFQMLNKSNAKTAGRKSFAYLSIFYKQLSYDISAESPQLNLITLFANIGGYSGLFLSVSVFSLIEVVQVLLEIFFWKFT
jgi:hypothetical protein